MSISPSEISFIRQSCAADYRIDGRSNLQHRPYMLLSPSSSPILSNGSSRLFLPGSTTDILCSIKAELVHPPFRSTDGAIDLNVDILPYMPNLTDRKDIRNKEMEVSSMLTHLLLPHLLDRNVLVVLEGRFVWRLNIDIMVVHCDGNLIDACSIAVRGAMQNLRLPFVVAVQKVGEENGNRDPKRASDEIMVDGDIANSIIPDGVVNCPIIITVCLIPLTTVAVSQDEGNNSSRFAKKKQENVMIVDPSKQEEECASTKIIMSIDTLGNICGVQKYGSSSVLNANVSGNIDFGMLSQIQAVAVSSSASAFAMIKKNHLDADTSAGKSNEYNIFFRGLYELQ